MMMHRIEVIVAIGREEWRKTIMLPFPPSVGIRLEFAATNPNAVPLLFQALVLDVDRGDLLYHVETKTWSFETDFEGDDASVDHWRERLKAVGFHLN
jgi:hypothetical protein